MAKLAEALAGLVRAMNQEIQTDYDKQLRRDDVLECVDSLLAAHVKDSADQLGIDLLNAFERSQPKEQ